MLQYSNFMKKAVKGLGLVYTQMLLAKFTFPDVFLLCYQQLSIYSFILAIVKFSNNNAF